MFYGYSAYEVFNIILKLLLFLGFAFLIDLIASSGYKLLLQPVRLALIRKGLIRLNWLIFVIFSVKLLLYFVIPAKFCGDPVKTRQVFVIGTLFILIYFPKILFILTLFCRWLFVLVTFLLQKLLKRKIVSNFLIKKYFIKTGLALQIIATLIILNGIFLTSKSITIKKVVLEYNELPPAFHGFRIIQISDLHLGSYKNTLFFEKAIRKINALQADVILFTGDMVNNTPDETLPYLDLFKQMHAKYGKFSILGNHDFGDYVRCFSNSQKDSSRAKLVELQKEMGFVPLTNKHQLIKLFTDSIYIAGVDNIGSPPFKVYGDLNKAINDIEPGNFVILLSHDPDHWKNEVINAKQHIHLTLSGHTHAMQLGIVAPNWKWSPAILRYVNWGGLYENNNKYLYVNTGLGMIGFLGRIGIRPEITEITLKRRTEP